MSTPFATVKARFESKEKLVAAVKELMTDALWLPRLSSDRGGNKGIERVSNAKLLRLHETLSAVEKKFGTRAKLIDALLEAENRTKDDGYKKRLESWAVPKLYDRFRTLTVSRTAGEQPTKEQPVTTKKKRPARAKAKKD